MKNKKNLIIIGIIVLFLVIAIICVFSFNNNWKDKFEIRDIYSSGLLEDDKSAITTGKIANISKNEYKDVYVVYKYYSKVNKKEYFDNCYVGDLSYGEIKEWKSTLTEEKRKEISMYEKKVEKVIYKIR